MLVLKNARIINWYPAEVLDLHDIIIENGLITEVLPSTDYSYSGEVIDLKGKYISPGIVCSHNHFYSALSRGIMANIKPSTDFVAILQNLWWRLDRVLDENSIYYSGVTAALDAIKCGTTSVIDHHASPGYIKNSLNVIKKGFDETGLRGILAYEVTERNGMDGCQEGIDESEDFLKSIADNEMIKSAVGIHAPFTIGNDSLKKISDICKKYNTGVHIHVSEDSFDRAYSHNFFEQEVLERLRAFDLVNEKALIVHGVHLTATDVEILNKKKGYLLTNPRSNMNNGVGYSDKLHSVEKLALGTDGIGSDMFDEIKFAFFKNQDAHAKLSYPDMLRIFSEGNSIMSEYFGKNFGKISEGFVADIVTYDYQPPTPLTSNNLAGHLLFGFSSNNVENVIINGKVVLKEKQFTFDTTDIYAKAQDEAAALWQRMDNLK